MRRYGGAPASPDRSRPWADPASSPPPKQQQQPQGRKIPVVYYLCRNRHLEHPHFIEVPLSSSDGLYLRDVVHRLTVLRGKGMPAMYSWSCKRSYKNGFVWHDLSDDDLIVPAQGNEYVLKGSELLDQSPPDRSQLVNSSIGGTNPKQHITENPIQESHSMFSRAQGPPSSSSSPTIVIKEANALPSSPLPAEQSPKAHGPGSSGNISPGPSEYRLYKPLGAADASTQTDDRRERKPRGHGHQTCIRGVSTDDGGGSLDLDSDQPHPGTNEISPTATSSSASSGGKTETLESLIRAEASKMNSFRILENEELFVPSVNKMKATNVLMQLITCGSISVKDHSLRLVPAYRPRFTHVRIPSPLFAGSSMLGELDCLSDNPRLMGLKLEDKEYFSGSLIETKKHREGVGVGMPTLKRSSSYNAERMCKSQDSKNDNDKLTDSSHSRCCPRTKPTEPSRNESTRSPISDCPRKTSAGTDSGQPSKGGSKRITDASSVKGPSMRLESFREEKEKVIKIEERLTSGARVIIQSRAPCDDSEGSSSS